MPRLHDIAGIQGTPSLRSLMEAHFDHLGRTFRELPASESRLLAHRKRPTSENGRAWWDWVLSIISNFHREILSNSQAEAHASARSSQTPDLLEETLNNPSLNGRRRPQNSSFHGTLSGLRPVSNIPAIWDTCLKPVFAPPGKIFPPLSATDPVAPTPAA